MTHHIFSPVKELVSQDPPYITQNNKKRANTNMIAKAVLIHTVAKLLLKAKAEQIINETVELRKKISPRVIIIFFLACQPSTLG